MHRQGCTKKMIAQAIEKDKSVVCRELKHNANPKGRYSFGYAQDMSKMRKERMKKPQKLNPFLKRQIVELIGQDWSPQQIEGRLKLEKRPYLSHESIYKIIREDRAHGGNPLPTHRTSAQTPQTTDGKGNTH